jgi:acyl carrier protein
MRREELRALVLEALAHIAPEVDAQALDPAKPLRGQVDLDSMDWLNFLVGLHERLGVEIPESDYARLGTVDQIVAYLAEKLAL